MNSTILLFGDVMYAVKGYIGSFIGFAFIIYTILHRRKDLSSIIVRIKRQQMLAMLGSRRGTRTMMIGTGTSLTDSMSSIRIGTIGMYHFMWTTLMALLLLTTLPPSIVVNRNRNGVGLIGVDGFASWLVDREMGCWTYLEEGEIIMNHSVLASNDSRVAGVYLEIIREDGQVAIPSVTTSSGSDEDEDSSDSEVTVITYAAAGETVRVKFVFPSSTNGNIQQALQFADVQYVLEVSNKGGTFTGPLGKVGCDGARVFGVNGRKKQKKDMTLTTATLVLSGDAAFEQVEVIGGWAAGHEAVILTPKLILKREVASAASLRTNNASVANTATAFTLDTLDGE
jgi:hypothetical protein